VENTDREFTEGLIGIMFYRLYSSRSSKFNIVPPG
jgi:hypothetical protein